MEILVAQVVIPLLGCVLTALIAPVIRKINKKFSLDIEDSTVAAAVNFAEEAAYKAYKTSGEKIPSSEKLDLAMQYVMDMIPDAKEAAYKERLQRKIEAKVNELLHAGQAGAQ